MRAVAEVSTQVKAAGWHQFAAVGGIIAAGVCGGLLSDMLADVIPGLGHGFWWTVFIGAAAMGVPAASWMRTSRRARRLLRSHLIRLGIPICLDCGYDLTGNVSGRCPECGAELKAFEGVSVPPALRREHDL